MPGTLLHLGATITCAHAGQATPVAPNPRVLVSGQPVVPLSSTYVIAGCTLPPPPAANGPCVTAQFITSASRVFANGVPLLLLDSQALCAPTGTPVIPLVIQTRAIGM
ncbi:MAG: hypothetical protein QNL62_16605 [Gammaproteobacteria bacterium]|nr:hypothetical protein [Gammaproteobacteria bacterium]